MRPDAAPRGRTFAETIAEIEQYWQRVADAHATSPAGPDANLHDYAALILTRIQRVKRGIAARPSRSNTDTVASDAVSVMRLHYAIIRQWQLDHHETQARLRPTRQVGAAKTSKKAREKLRAFGLTLTTLLDKMAEPDLEVTFRKHLRNKHGANTWDNTFTRDQRNNELRKVRRRYANYLKLLNEPA